MGKRVAPPVDGGRVTLTRTRAEYVRAVAVAFGIGAGLVGGAGTLVVVILRTAGANLPFDHLPDLGVGHVLGAAAVVGLGAAAAVAVFARPRVVLAGDSGGAGGPAGYGQLWPGSAGLPDGGRDGGPVAEVTGRG